LSCSLQNWHCSWGITMTTWKYLPTSSSFSCLRRNFRNWRCNENLRVHVSSPWLIYIVTQSSFVDRDFAWKHQIPLHKLSCAVSLVVIKLLVLMIHLATLVQIMHQLAPHCPGHLDVIRSSSNKITCFSTRISFMSLMDHHISSVGAQSW
jgi:hypothetical protein